jgi:NADPH:quinone reductase-like Zn-dependent oxidoreductase
MTGKTLSAIPSDMDAIVVERFGTPDVLSLRRLATPRAGPGEALIEVRAAGVGPWDALIRSGGSAVSQSLPLIPGSDVSGVIAEAGEDCPYAVGEAVYGVTNARFVGGYAQYSVVECGRLARKPAALDFPEAAALPVTAVTALQMLERHAALQPGQAVLIHGATGNVGSAAIQVARALRLKVYATARSKDRSALSALGVDGLVDLSDEDGFAADAALDFVGGSTQPRLFDFIKPGGRLLSAVSPPDDGLAAVRSVDARFILVDVTTMDLDRISAMANVGALAVPIGERLPLDQARQAHEMMAGQPHMPGKIVLIIS